MSSMANQCVGVGFKWKVKLSKPIPSSNSVVGLELLMFDLIIVIVVGSDVYSKVFRKVRSDQQLEDEAFVSFRGFTRKLPEYRTYLTKEEIEERADYLETIFS